MERRIDRCLQLLRNWAEKRVATGTEPPWAWYQYMKLIETVSAIQGGRAAVAQTTSGSLGVRGPTETPGPTENGVADIGTRRRRRRRDDPPLPM
jgi:hypothetical protein